MWLIAVIFSRFHTMLSPDAGFQGYLDGITPWLAPTLYEHGRDLTRANNK